MAELRLTGPTEDGDALRLSEPDGREHTLALSADLRRLVVEGAATEDDASAPDGDSTPLETVPTDAEADGPALEEEAETTAADDAPGVLAPAPLTDQESVRAAATQEAVPLAPREIQQRIRAGASVEQVARESGNAFSRIRTYGYPVLAERGWIAQQARAVEVWVGGPDLYSDLVQDGGPTTLGELAEHRLAELGVDAASLEWDAWREDQAGWTVAARFTVAGLTGLPTREEPPARWTFRPAGRHLEPENAWARALSEAEAWDVFSREPAAEPLRADSDAQDSPTPAGAGAAAADRDADLLEILRVRRGQRVGADLESDDALAHLLAREHVQRSEREAADAPRGLVPVDGQPATTTADATLQGTEPEPAAETGPEAATAAHDPAPAPAADAPEEAVEPAAADPAPRERPARPAMPAVTPRPRARSAARRASVPSWDEIVFGRKDD